MVDIKTASIQELNENFSQEQVIEELVRRNAELATQAKSSKGKGKPTTIAMGVFESSDGKTNPIVVIEGPHKPLKFGPTKFWKLCENREIAELASEAGLKPLNVAPTNLTRIFEHEQEIADLLTANGHTKPDPKSEDQ